MKNVPLGTSVKFICKLSGLRCRITPDEITIFSLGMEFVKK